MIWRALATALATLLALALLSPETSGQPSGTTAGTTFGLLYPTRGTAVGFRNPASMMASATVDNSGNLNVNCAVGCGGSGTSSVRTTSDSTLTATVTQSSAAALNVTAVQSGIWNVRSTSDSTLTATVTQSAAANLNALVAQGASASTTSAWPVNVQDDAGVMVRPGDATNKALRVNVVAALPTGANIIGAVSQAGIWNVRSTSDSTLTATVTQSSAANLNATVVQGAIWNVRTTSDSTLTATVTQNNVWNVRTTSDSTLTATVSVSNAVGIASNSSVNLAKVGNDTVVTGGAPGSQSVGGTAANNATINQNPVLIGAEARAIGTYYASATSANQRQIAADQMGAQFVRSGGAIAWACSVNKQATGYLQCQAPANQGFRLYVTDVIAQSSTSTAGIFSLAYGTGANCATGQTALFPGGTPTNTGFTYPANTAAPTVIRFETPLQPAAGTAICASGTGTNTLNLYLSGFVAP